MRNSTSNTPKANTVKDESVSNAEKASAKKLIQARLPFKIIAPGLSPVGSKVVTTPSVAGTDEAKVSNATDGRKRKLSYGSEDGNSDDVVQEGSKVSKENIEILSASTKKKKLAAVNDMCDVVSLLDDDDNVEGNKDNVNSSVNVSDKKGPDLKTPKSLAKDKKKGAGTPQSAQKDKNGSATKLQIKLPLNAGKKKRRKLNLNKNSSAEKSFDSSKELSSDDIEEIAVDLNPLKRKKLNTESDKQKDETECAALGNTQDVESISLDSEPEERKGNKLFGTEEEALNGKFKNESSEKNFVHENKNDTTSQPIQQSKQSDPELNAKSTSERTVLNSTTNNILEESIRNDDIENIQHSDSSNESENGKYDKEDLAEIIISDNEADDETDNLGGNKNASDIGENPKLKHDNAIQLLKNGKKSNSSKSLTPKQVKLMERRKKAREEKERKLQEEKIKKQQEKEEKEMVKKREREEKEELKRKEREEKEEQKRKEREEKERKRLAEIEAKNEEKRKKNEAKEEELRKKEDERKRKEQEKEEAELKKKKAAQAFTKFFVAKTPNNAPLKSEEESNTGDETKPLAFRPFQIKGDMKLAPILRKDFTETSKKRLDDLLGCNNKSTLEGNDNENIVKPLTKSHLYLSELRSGKILPGKWRRPSTESKDDIILVEDELERVGQEIVEDVPAYVREEMRVKFYKFHDNRRPPYYGTWRKKSSVVKPRRPFAQDMKFFDYDADSDEEWEEEEPGESLEDGSDEDKEKESEDDDYEVDNEWFVPHGHLSDEELQNEDEFGIGDDNTREAQKAKLQLLQQEFAQEMKRKTEKIKPRLIGCIWADINGNQPAECAKILWDTLEKKSMLFNDPPVIEEPEADRSSEANSPSTATNGNTERTTDKLKPISLSDNMVKDLTRLVHGNNHAKNFLINEYIAYIEKTEESVKNGGVRKPLKSVVRDKIDEIAEWQAVDANASSIQEIEQTNDNIRDKKKKKKVKRRLCWVVKQEMLNKMDLSSLKLKNSWKYTLPPKFVNSDKRIKMNEGEEKLTGESISTSSEESAKKQNSTSLLANVVTEKVKQSNNPSPAKRCSNQESSTGKNAISPATPKEKKRVPLLMSVARGQQISTPAKNKLISQFLHQKNKDRVNPSSPTTPSRRSNAVISPTVEDDDVVILD